jgi:photosystem II stability/assembly factor-like uncharacterized protein
VGGFGNAVEAPGPDGGWKALKLPAARSLRQIMFRAGVGHIAGDGGTVLVSRDGGHAWEIQASGTDRDLHGIDFLDADHGMACGADGTLLATADGGATWVAAARPAPGLWFHKVRMLGEPGSALLAASDGIWRTRDGGAHLERVLSHALPFLNLEAAGSATAYAADFGSLWRTRNGGVTWDSVFVTSVISDVQAFSPDSVFVYGPSGLRGKTRDGGATWDIGFDWESRDMLSARFTEGSIGYGAGNNGNLFATRDGGLSWTPFRSGGVPLLRGEPRFFDGKIGYALGAAGLLRSGDGGLGWAPDPNAIAALAVNAICVAGSLTAYGAGNAGALVKTRDAGRTWERLSAGTDRNLASLSFPRPDTGWAVTKGAYGLILKTVDGGRHWQAQGNPTASPLTLIRFLDTRRGFALASPDQLLSTHNGGQDWTLTSMRWPHAPDWLEFPEASVGYARGLSDSGSVLLKSVNGGASWTPLPLEDGIQGFHFLDRDVGYAAGWAKGGEAQGLILKTMDGGLTWSRYETGTPELNMIFFPKPGEGIATGPYGTILEGSVEIPGQATRMPPSGWKRRERRAGPGLVPGLSPAFPAARGPVDALGRP